MTNKQFIKSQKNLIDSFRKVWVEKHLVTANGNVSQAARNAKIDRSNFLRFMRELKVDKNKLTG